MDDTAIACNSPVPHLIAGKRYRCKMLTFEQIGELDGIIALHAKRPLQVLKETFRVDSADELLAQLLEDYGVESFDRLDEIDEYAREALLRSRQQVRQQWAAVKREDDRWSPPRSYAGLGAQVIADSPEATRAFLMLLFGTVQAIDEGEAEAIRRQINPVKLGQLYQFAMGVTETDPKAERDLDP